MSLPRFVYSGECRKCDLGTETPYSDLRGERLYTGDIVLILSENGFDGLTVVVCDQYQSYSDGTHIPKEGDLEFFVMGLKSVSLDAPGSWSILRVKRWSDAVIGEHWRDYGFNYRDS